MAYHGETNVIAENFFRRDVLKTRDWPGEDLAAAVKESEPGSVIIET
jgi:hypothetical protein